MLSVHYKKDEIINIIVTNILKMLERRKVIKSWENEYNKIKDDLVNKQKFDVGGFNINIEFNDEKINSISSGTPLDTYLSLNTNIPKIVILKEVAAKAHKQFKNDYLNSEYFLTDEMLEDIPSKIFIPQHILIDKEEKEELLSKINENDLSKILTSDVMVRYYGAKIGDIFKIIRPSILAGKNVFYRKVVNG